MLNSLKKNKKGIILMLLSSICVCFGQLFWKIYISNSIIYLILGFALYAIGALFMLNAYKYGELSVLQPILSSNYVFAIILASTILHEKIYVNDFFGIFAIIIGVILVCGGSNG